MSDFVLVHGAFHGSWCWDRVIPLLRACGHRAVAIDLPGRGTRPAPIAERTLASYADAVCEALLAAGGPVVLTGHSMGGVVVTQAAERLPERVARLVYVAAFLPADGQCLLDLAKQDTGSELFPNLMIDQPRGICSVRPESHVRVFYEDCDSAVARAASARLVDEALAPGATPVHTTRERWGRLPRAYFCTSLDRCLTPALQERMLRALPCDPVVELATGHSPFLSKPEKLARVLASLA